MKKFLSIMMLSLSVSLCLVNTPVHQTPFHQIQQQRSNFTNPSLTGGGVGDSHSSTFGTKTLVNTNKITTKALSYKNWFKTEYNYDLTTHIVNVYSCSRYVDFNVRDVYVAKVKANDLLDFTTAYTAGTETTYQDTYYEAYSAFESVKKTTEFKDESGFKLGGEIAELNFSFCNNKKVEVTYSTEFSQSIQNSISSTCYYNTVIEDLYTYNNEHNYDVIYRLGYRQKFNVYYIEVLVNNPEQKKNDRGIGGTDYTYTDNFSETKTYYFFVPSDNLTYIDETIYKVDAEGNYVNIDKRIENNIVYL